MTTEIQKIHKGEITLSDVQEKIITIQNKNVFLDSDVAWLYGVKTRVGCNGRSGSAYFKRNKTETSAKL